MQEAALAAILHTDRDVVVLAPTGSGKTLAYLLPIASRLDAKLDEVQAVVIVPSRELALQSCEVFRSMGTGLRPIALYGGRATMDEHREVTSTAIFVPFTTQELFMEGDSLYYGLRVRENACRNYSYQPVLNPE